MSYTDNLNTSHIAFNQELDDDARKLYEYLNPDRNWFALSNLVRMHWRSSVYDFKNYLLTKDT